MQLVVGAKQEHRRAQRMAARRVHRLCTILYTRNKTYLYQHTHRFYISTVNEGKSYTVVIPEILLSFHAARQPREPLISNY